MASLEICPPFDPSSSSTDIGALMLAADRESGHAADPSSPPSDPELPTNPWHDSDLAGLADLKWLMAGHGEWLDLPRLRRDDGYARAALDEAQQLPSELIRQVARRMRCRLEPTHN
ncbi:MAG: hypothetical protein RIQ60_528 [Pseudomonadota bacterium]|jgi:hypothetical protein